LKTQSSENPYRLDRKIFDRIDRYRQPKIIHSVGLPIGGTLPLNESYLNCLIESIEVVKPVWVSEHLSFNRTRNKQGEFNTGFLLPPLQTPDAVNIAAENIKYLRDRLSVPFAFETGVNYLQPLAGEMTDGNFFAAVAEAADCGILLDLHNLWCNEKNGRSSVRDVIAELQSDRVWEIHLAGGQYEQEYWLDAHSGIVPTSVMDLAADRSSKREFVEILDRDRGIEILQYLVSGLRGGTAVDALKLSSRLLILSLGKPVFRKLLKEFWKTTPPEMFASEEATNLANYLKASDLNVSYLEDVLNFELASYRVLIEGLPQRVKFSCEPISLLNALQENRLPENIIEEEFEIVLDP
jgi:uncharacterized protein